MLITACDVGCIYRVVSTIWVDMDLASKGLELLGFLVHRYYSTMAKAEDETEEHNVEGGGGMEFLFFRRHKIGLVLR